MANTGIDNCSPAELAARPPGTLSTRTFGCDVPLIARATSCSRTSLGAQITGAQCQHLTCTRRCARLWLSLRIHRAARSEHRHAHLRYDATRHIVPMYQSDISDQRLGHALWLTGVAMRRVDYDTEQYKDYARGRALTEPELEAWMTAFRAVLPEERPLAGLDVGSGTGRFSPALAHEFGPVAGVEPSVRMREIAQSQSQYPGVRYLAGSAEDMPVPSGSADYALMFLSWHHVQDKQRAARELARVLRPGGRLLLRANFSDHHPRPWWLEHFPRGLEVDTSLFQPLDEAIATFTSAGWRVASFDIVTPPSSGTRADMLERLHLRTLSFFAQLTPDEVETGLRRLDEVVAADPGAPSPALSEPLLTFEQCA
jgi:ubiquinone/menaquinone biosynthesis C-methylase UbiE